MTGAIEVTEFVPRGGEAAQFEAAFQHALPVLTRQHGVRRIWFGAVVEGTGSFLLLVEWVSLADHVERFRGSDDFDEFVGHFRSLLDSPAKVLHIQADPVLTAGRDAS